MEDQESSRPGFVQSKLPWLIAVGALALYAITLNPWVTLASLPVTAKVTGWDWSPALNSPVHFLVTYPCRWLPAGAQLLVLNALSAIFAALTLGLLARAVALLPHDRTVEQRVRGLGPHGVMGGRLGWIPPVAAALVCGLQLSFWENATVATGEMLDLLLFAYCLRCVLEFRRDEEESWLNKFALVYGIGLTNNWAMVGFLPLFVAAIFWIRGMGFLNPRFLLRMVGLGSIGVSLYLLLPLLDSLGDGNLSFWKLLLTELSNHKSALMGFPRSMALVLSLTSILPVIVMGIRWPSSFGGASVVGSGLEFLMSMLVHAGLLVACLWLAFDPGFSPRALGMGVPFLSFYFLSALSVGYYSGFFLLLASEPNSRNRLRASAAQGLVHKALAGVTVLAVMGVPAGLAWQNGPVIRALNGPILQQFANQLSQSVPANNAVIYSDNPLLLHLVQAVRHASGLGKASVFVETRMINFALYQLHLRRLHPSLWPALPEGVKPLDSLDPGFLSRQISTLASQMEVHYLHPSFGYFFETVYARQVGMAYRLIPYGTNSLAPPTMTGAEIQKTEQYLAQCENVWKALPSLSARDLPSLKQVSEWYSRSLNHWGVELQRAGQIAPAGQRFAQAYELNTNNLVASLNLRFNKDKRENKPSSVVIDKTLERAFNEFGGIDSMLGSYGPFDEPQLCLLQGRAFVQNNLNRQAALLFRRSFELDPSNSRAALELASACYLGEAFTDAQAAITALRQRPGMPLGQSDDIDASRLQALILNARGESAQAEEVLVALRRKYPQQEGPLASLAEFYANSQRFKEARQTLEAQLAINPENLLPRFYHGIICMKMEAFPDALSSFDMILRKQPGNPEALLNKAVVFIQTKRYQDAIPLLNDILRSQPENRAALMNRAIAFLQSEQLDAAQRDYESLDKLVPNSHAVQFGLGTVAWKRKQNSEAVRFYERYLELLAKAQPEFAASDEAKEVQARLKQLKGGQP